MRGVGELKVKERVSRICRIARCGVLCERWRHMVIGDFFKSGIGDGVR